MRKRVAIKAPTRHATTPLRVARVYLRVSTEEQDLERQAGIAQQAKDAGYYVAYPISYRQLEEMMQERGVEVDHSSLNRWVIKYTPALDKAFRQRKRSVGTSWRLDETYIRVKGQWVRISSTGYYFRTRPFDILISLLGQRNLAP